MNETLLTLVEQLSRAAMQADVSDLPSLADVHSHFEQLRAGIAAENAAVPAPVGKHVASAMSLIEKLILRDVKDTQRAIDELHRTVAEVASLITGKPSEEPHADVAAAPETAVAPAAPVPAEAASVSGDQQLKPDDVPLIREFVTEAGGHIESAEAELLKLDSNPEDLDAINAIFRGFHTIKGVAGFLNLRDINGLAHAAENLLDLARKGRLEISGGILDVVLESVDVMKRLLGMLDQAAKTGSPIVHDGTVDGLVARLHVASTRSSEPGAGLKQGEATPAPASAESPPANSESTSPAKAEATPPADTTPKAGTTGYQAENTVKVTTTRLDALINMVGEMVIAQSMVSQDVAPLISGNQRISRNVSHLGKITRELQDLTMTMRMVPIQGVFQKMMRLVRDLARKAGKDIELRIIGGETELDRNVVEAVADPLVHMVRNAADHGIESADDRVKAGKSPTGHIELRAYHQAGNIVVEISDDGKGLNKQRILKKAREAGLVREGQELSEQDIFRLIFAPGLSTAEKITDVSGRGVGMDVVRRNVEAMRGRIDITSVEGRGSTFSIRLPLTLAVIDGLVVKVGSQRYILPITSIEQSLQPKASQLSTLQNRGEMCMIRGRLLPICRLHTLFSLTPRTHDPSQALLVLVQDGTRRACLLVDEILGQQQVVIKNLGEIMGNLPGISGGAILGDGTISLILDVPGLIDLVAST